MSSSTSPATAAWPPARAYAAGVHREELAVGRGQARRAGTARPGRGGAWSATTTAASAARGARRASRPAAAGRARPGRGRCCAAAPPWRRPRGEPGRRRRRRRPARCRWPPGPAGRRPRACPASPSAGRCPRQQPDPGVEAGRLPHEVGGAVGAAVVADEDLEVGHVRLLGQARQQHRQGALLVAGGDQDGHPLRGRRRVGGRAPQPGRVPRRVRGEGDRERRARPGERGGGPGGPAARPCPARPCRLARDRLCRAGLTRAGLTSTARDGRTAVPAGAAGGAALRPVEEQVGPDQQAHADQAVRGDLGAAEEGHVGQPGARATSRPGAGRGCARRPRARGTTASSRASMSTATSTQPA